MKKERFICGDQKKLLFSRSRDTIMNVECLICWKFNSVWCRNILLSTRQLSVLLYEGNNKLNLIVTSITESLRNNQANDYLGTKTHLLITLKAPVDCSIQPTLSHVPKWCQQQRLALILVFSIISLCRTTFLLTK